MSPRLLFHRIAADRRGVTALEFALFSPVLLLGIMGLSDLCHRAYVQSVLEGAVQKAGRDSSIQGGGNNTDMIDQKVEFMVLKVAHNATFVSSRKNYDSFGSIAPEPFVDAPFGLQPKDGICDHGEVFTDVNGNGTWDADPGLAGQGGASDVAYYTMTVSYPRLFPLGKLLGWSSIQVISASTILKNQPYATQDAFTPGTGKCP